MSDVADESGTRTGAPRETAASSGAVPSPDSVALGFLDAPPDPRRYGEPMDDPAEVGGIILRMVPRGSRVLDVGCGGGFMGRMLRDRADATFVGVELDADRVAHARGLGLDVRQAPLDDALVSQIGPFDAVLFLDMLEHVADPLTLLVCARRGLAPTGRLVISVPNVAHWTVRLKLLFGRFEYRDCGIMDATHLRWFTAATIRTLVERAGLRVDEMAFSAGSDLAVYQRRFFRRVGMRPVRWLVRTMPRIFGAQIVLRCSPDTTGLPTGGAAWRA